MSFKQLKQKTMTLTDEVNKRFPKGTRVSGIVRSHTHYGYFVDILGIEFPGLVETILFDESEKEKIPEIGSRVEAVILQFRDTGPFGRQFRLGVHPEDLAKSESIKPLEK